MKGPKSTLDSVQHLVVRKIFDRQPHLVLLAPRQPFQERLICTSHVRQPALFELTPLLAMQNTQLIGRKGKISSRISFLLHVLAPVSRLSRGCIVAEG